MRSEVAHEIKHKQDNEHQAESASTTGMSPIGIAATTKYKNENDNEKDEHHKGVLELGYLTFAEGESVAASLWVTADNGVVTVSVGLAGEWVGSKPVRRAWM